MKGRAWRESVGPRPTKDLSGEVVEVEEEETKRREYPSYGPFAALPSHPRASMN